MEDALDFVVLGRVEYEEEDEHPREPSRNPDALKAFGSFAQGLETAYDWVRLREFDSVWLQVNGGWNGATACCLGTEVVLLDIAQRLQEELGFDDGVNWPTVGGVALEACLLDGVAHWIDEGIGYSRVIGSPEPGSVVRHRRPRGLWWPSDG